MDSEPGLGNVFGTLSGWLKMSEAVTIFISLILHRWSYCEKSGEESYERNEWSGMKAFVISERGWKRHFESSVNHKDHKLFLVLRFL